MGATKARGFGQIRLSLLAIWILGASVFFAMIRGATGFWGGPVPVLNLDRVSGVILLAVSSIVLVKMIAAALVTGPSHAFGFGRAWRWIAAIVLIGLALSESSILREVGRANGVVAFANRDGWPQRLHALCLAIGLIGVLLGLVPVRANRPRRRGWGAINVIFAALSGLLILTVYEMAIPYLILIALEAVRHAMLHPAMVDSYFRFGLAADPVLFDRRIWPSMEDGLISAGTAAVIAMLACGLTAHWIGRDLRSRDEAAEPARTGAGLWYRVATAALTWVMGFDLLFIALPRLQPWLAEGLWTVLIPTDAAVIAASFIVLAAGITARGLAGPIVVEALEVTAPSPRSRVRWLALMVLKTAIVIGLSLLILAAISKLRGDDSLPWYVPWSLADLLATADQGLTVSTSTAIYFDLGKNPESILILGAVVGVVVLLGRYLFGRRGEAPIDRIAGDPRRIGRFVGTWIAISGVIFTLFPSFVLGGLALLHFGLKWFGR